MKRIDSELIFTRLKRSADMIKSDLDQIKGIGPKTKEMLNKEIWICLIKSEFASSEDLEKVVGKSKAAIISGYFRN